MPLGDPFCPVHQHAPCRCLDSERFRGLPVIGSPAVPDDEVWMLAPGREAVLAANANSAEVAPLTHSAIQDAVRLLREQNEPGRVMTASTPNSSRPNPFRLEYEALTPGWPPYERPFQNDHLNEWAPGPEEVLGNTRQTLRDVTRQRDNFADMLMELEMAVDGLGGDLAVARKDTGSWARALATVRQAREELATWKRRAQQRRLNRKDDW